MRPTLRERHEFARDQQTNRNPEDNHSRGTQCKRNGIKKLREWKKCSVLEDAGSKAWTTSIRVWLPQWSACEGPSRILRRPADFKSLPLAQKFSGHSRAYECQ